MFVHSNVHVRSKKCLDPMMDGLDEIDTFNVPTLGIKSTAIREIIGLFFSFLFFSHPGGVFRVFTLYRIDGVLLVT